MELMETDRCHTEDRVDTAPRVVMEALPLQRCRTWAELAQSVVGEELGEMEDPVEMESVLMKALCLDLEATAEMRGMVGLAVMQPQ